MLSNDTLQLFLSLNWAIDPSIIDAKAHAISVESISDAWLVVFADNNRDLIRSSLIRLEGILHLNC